MSVSHPQKFRASSDRAQSGVALVIVLLAIALLTTIVVFFLLFVGQQRQLSSASSAQAKADILAQAAFDNIVGDFRSEITAGSAISTTGSVSVFIPSSRANVTPYRALPTADLTCTNLVTISSSGLPFWQGASFASAPVSPNRSAALNSTQSPTSEGRYMDINQWNKPYLLTSTASVPANFVPPDWIVMTRGGAVTNASSSTMPTMAQLADRTPSNNNYALGRYAYAVYNEGGLIDINVAGAPTSGTTATSTTFQAKRGLLPQIDLANVPGIDNQANATALVTWRNAATASSANLYTNYVSWTTNGFMSVASPGQVITRSNSDGTTTPFTVPSTSSDQKFVSRQDLINYAIDNPTQITTSALLNLGTFTREVNGPTYDLNTEQPAGFANTLNTTFNQSLINTRVSTGFIREDGTTANSGDPLIKTRFPLTRLALLNPTAIGTADATSAIYRYFGLSRTSATGASNQWIYNHGGASGVILKLSDVAALTVPREPDFFELLQAAILQGSLGKTVSPLFSDTSTYDALTAAQIIQIGVNIIDQYGTSLYPTRITFAGTDYSGLKNLPYLSRVLDFTYRPLGPTPPAHPTAQGGWGAATTTYKQPWVGFWLMPEVWDPFLTVAPSATAAAIPLRFVVTGGFTCYVSYTSSTTSGVIYPSYSYPYPGTTQYGNLQALFPSPPTATGAQIAFNPSITYAEPTLLSTKLGATPTGTNCQIQNTTPIADLNNEGLVGIWLATVLAPDWRKEITTTPAQMQANHANLSPGGIAPLTLNPVHFLLQYQDANSNWITYDDMRNITGVNDEGSETPLGNRLWTFASAFSWNARSDPTSDRFGVSLFGDDDTNINIATTAGTSTPVHRYIRATAAAGNSSGQAFTASTGWTTTAGNFNAGALSDNLSSGASYYTDPDGTQRLGDGAYSTSDNLAGYPLATSNTPSRPVMLNRAFASVAELGYAGRGEPWKHLDFFTNKSADSALLDVFSVDNDPAVVAGRFDPNTRSVAALAAVLAGGGMSEKDATTLSPTVAQSVAQTIVNSTSAANGNLLNRSELATIIAPALTYGNETDDHIKARREAAVRALADISNTRTWNLMIDLVVQAGNYPPGSNLQQFHVTGAKRYWVHVAIDRYTNKVIDQTWEAVHD